MAIVTLNYNVEIQGEKEMKGMVNGVDTYRVMVSTLCWDRGERHMDALTQWPDFKSSICYMELKIVYDGKYLSVRKWMIGLTLLTDNTKITTKNRGKNKFQPAFNVKVYLQTKTDKIILSRSITGLLTPNIFFLQDFTTHLHPPPSLIFMV